MRAKTIIQKFIILIFMIFPITSAQGEESPDFKFDVPVDIRFIHPSVREAEVACEVYHNPIMPGMRTRTIGRGRARVPLKPDPNRGLQFQGHVYPTVNIYEGVTYDATDYKCWLIFDGAGTFLSQSSTTPDKFKYNSSSAYTPVVSGNL